MKYLDFIKILLLSSLIYSCNSNNDYKIYKTNGEVDSIVYKVYLNTKQLERGVKDASVVITKGKLPGRGDIITFTATNSRGPSWLAYAKYITYGTEEEKGEGKLLNGTKVTRHTIILADANYNRANHWLHKYYIDDKLVLISDEDTESGGFRNIVLDERLVDLDKQ